MIEFLRELIENKHICILGFGKEGESSYNLLRKIFPLKIITIADKDDKLNAHPLLDIDKNVRIISGQHYLEGMATFDLILKSPGIPFKLLGDVNASCIMSQTEIFIKYFRKQIIGITGTKGKSTTSSLIYHIIQQQTSDTILVGNIGVPPFDLIDKIGKKTLIVYELSSHQLEHIGVSPHTAIILNLFQEHLDHYQSLLKYHEAKLNIARFQEEKDNFIFHYDDNQIQDLIKTGIAALKFPYSLKNEIEYGCFINNGLVYLRTNKRNLLIFDLLTICNLKGDHNLLNIMAAASACKLSGISEEAINKGIRSFLPLEHRMEYVGNFGGIDFFNDSIATIPEAAIAAIKAIKNVDTLILGGYDRGINYVEFCDFLITSEINNFIFIGAAGKRMFKLFEQKKGHKKHLYSAEDMEKAVLQAKKDTPPGKVCLLSPAAASYDIYKNFAERGSDFKRLVKS